MQAKVVSVLAVDSKLNAIQISPVFEAPPSDPTSLEACRLRYGSHESRRLLKNLIVLGFAFVMLFSAFLATANLQSSINQGDGLGTYALASVYATFILASTFLPPLVIYKLRAKTTMIVVISGYVLYVAAQFHPTFWTLVPAGAYLGVCGANLWAASSAYITRIAQEFAYLNNLSFSSILQRFFGAFFLFFHSSQIWGNLISTSVLATGSEGVGDSDNSTTGPVDLSSCGAQLCPFDRSTPLDANSNSNSTSAEAAFVHPDMSKIYLLFGIYTGCSIAAAVIIFLLLDPAARYGELDLKNKAKPKALELLIATIKHWRKPTQILIIPISIWAGMQEAFVGAEFTMAFISCAWGIEYIGLVMLCFGVSASIFSFIVGWCTERVGRPFMFCTAGLLDLCCLVTMLHWSPTPDQPFMYFAITGVWGVADGVWGAQVKALYADIFPHTAEAAFSNAGIWISIGLIIVYLVADKICVFAKAYLCIGVLVLAVASYLCIEVIEKRRKQLAKAPNLKADEKSPVQVSKSEAVKTKL